MSFLSVIEEALARDALPLKIYHILTKFYASYKVAITKNGHKIEEYDPILLQFLDLIIKNLQTPHEFEPFHRALRKPFDYYHFGLDMLRPLVIFEQSKSLGHEELKKAEEQLKKGENVILFANHQTEPDPQAISLLLEKKYPLLAEEMIFVAGHRVISDPLAVPFSLGRNLLCIYSKKYIEHPPEEKEKKQLHNQRTMKQMGQLLADGGRCIYVAPSGGRDRPDAAGSIHVAKFDPQSIEMFWLMSQQSDHPCHFYPLSLMTYDLLPPPCITQRELSEKREAHCTPIHLILGKEINMNDFPGSEKKDKRARRKIRAEYIWDQVVEGYNRLL